MTAKYDIICLHTNQKGGHIETKKYYNKFLLKYPEKSFPKYRRGIGAFNKNAVKINKDISQSICSQGRI